MLWGVVSGHFWRDFLPVGPKSFLRDFIAAARFRLEHHLGEYNAVQRVFYWGVLALVALMLVSGIAIWKPVQTYPLVSLFGGFQGARLVHFLGMALIVGFIVVHVALVVLVPRTFIAMVHRPRRRTRTARAERRPCHEPSIGATCCAAACRSAH